MENSQLKTSPEVRFQDLHLNLFTWNQETEGVVFDQ